MNSLWLLAVLHKKVYFNVIFQLLPIIDLSYNQLMNKNSLANTNPHLKDKKSMRKQIIRSVASSTAIETGESIRVIENRLRNKTNPYRVTLA